MENNKQERLKVIVDLYTSGKSLREVGRIVSLAAKNVLVILRKAGIPRVGPGVQPTWKIRALEILG